ncbi:MAG: FRG domain-containing protein [Promethearchaeota archaeon]
MSWYDFKCWQQETEWVLRNYKISEHQFNIANHDYNIDDSFDYLPESGTYPIITVKKYSDVVDIYGELKSYFSDRGLIILSRGQGEAYNFVQRPSIFRFLPEWNWKQLYETTYYSIKNWLKSLEFFLNLFRSATIKFESEFINMTPNLLIWEPILAHYGWKTRWLDLVDNINIACWFACVNLKTQSIMNKDFGYLFLYGIKANDKIAKGVAQGPNQRLVNLREAFSSKALRPHIQQAFSLCDIRLLEITSQLFIEFNEVSLEKRQMFQLVRDIYYWSNYEKYILCVIRVPQLELRSISGISNSQVYPTFRNNIPSPNTDHVFKEMIKLDEIYARVKPYGIPSALSKIGEIEKYIYGEKEGVPQISIDKWKLQEFKTNVDLLCKSKKDLFEPEDYIGLNKFVNFWDELSSIYNSIDSKSIKEEMLKYIGEKYYHFNQNDLTEYVNKESLVPDK